MNIKYHLKQKQVTFFGRWFLFVPKRAPHAPRQPAEADGPILKTLSIRGGETTGTTYQAIRIACRTVWRFMSWTSWSGFATRVSLSDSRKCAGDRCISSSVVNLVDTKNEPEKIGESPVLRSCSWCLFGRYPSCWGPEYVKSPRLIRLCFSSVLAPHPKFAIGLTVSVSPTIDKVHHSIPCIYIVIYITI